MTEVAAAILYREDGRFLTCQRPAYKARPLQWEFPGGKLEPGETPQQAICREIKEELNLDIAADAVITEVLHTYPDLTIRLTLLRCHILQGVPTLLEHMDARFVNIQEALQLDLCPADRELLLLLQDIHS